VTADELSTNLQSYRALAAKGELLQIEEGIMSTRGGCVVRTGDSTYIELVAGHLSGLLRHAWCQYRWLKSLSRINSLYVSQCMMIKQHMEHNEIVPGVSLSTSFVDKVTKFVAEVLAVHVAPRLYEFIVDDSDSVYFVDYKPYPWALKFCPLFGHSARSADVLYGSRLEGRIGCIRKFNLATIQAVDSDTTLCIDDKALLSHFVTYSLQKGVRCILAGSDN
jgi:hypothetical protein